MFFRRALLHIIHAHAFYYPTPLNLTYFWGLGSVSGIFLVLQMVTGIFLAMYYVPSVEYAFASIDYIMREVNYGWLIRFAHTNGASFFFFIVYAHIGRTLYFGYYFYQRRFLWFSGIILFLLMMATAFLGYVLPWGQMSFWGATVITNLFTAIPFVGRPFALWLWGGYSVGAATLTRFFSFHYCLPFIIVAVVLIHLVLLHQDGSNNNFGILAVPDKISFYPYFYVKDYFGLLVIILVYAGFIFYTPDLLNHPDNYIEANPLVTPAHIVPEWYFLPFYAILRSVPNKLGGVVAMALAIFIYFFLPFGFRAVRSLYIGTRFLHQVTVWYFFGVIVILGILGGRPIEDPYLFVSQLFVFLYFLFFSVLVWLDHFVAEVQNRGVSFIRSFTFSGYSFFLGDTQTLTPAIIRTLGIRSSVAMSQVKYVRKRLARGDLSFWILSRINTAWQALSTSIFLTHRFFSAAIKYRLLFLSKTARIASHPFHLVTESPWPVLVAFSFFGLMLSLVAVMHDYIGLSALWAVLFLVICVTAWFIDMVNESTFEGSHTYLVQRGLKLGVILFIVSEVMFFFSFFWGFFHSSLTPVYQIGGIWPPVGIETFDPWGVPLINTLILLTSGVTVTWSHFAAQHSLVRTNCLTLVESSTAKKATLDAVLLVDFYFILPSVILDAIVYQVHAMGLRFNLRTALPRFVHVIRAFFAESHAVGERMLVQFFAPFNVSYLVVFVPLRAWFSYFFFSSRVDTLWALVLTITLGVLFTAIQFFEYVTAPFNIADGIFGSTFFLTTGFHGLHVIVGSIFLYVAYLRMLNYHFTKEHHVGFEGAIWYWHFVDVVWLCLYISIYHWGV